MATKKVTTQKPASPLLDEKAAGIASNAAYAISHLADLLAQSKLHAGFEGVESKHENAITLAIQILGDHVCHFTGTYLEELHNSQEGAV